MSKKSKKIFHHLRLFLSVVAVLASIAGLAAYATSPVSAQGTIKKSTDNKCQVDKDGKIVNPDASKPCALDGKICNNVGDVAQTNCETGDPALKNGCTNGDCSKLITDYINPFIKLLTILMGIVVTISIVWAGIQYSSSSGDPNKVSEAKKRLTNSIVAFLAYLFLFSFLQYILPGGII